MCLTLHGLMFIPFYKCHIRVGTVISILYMYVYMMMFIYNNRGMDTDESHLFTLILAFVIQGK